MLRSLINFTPKAWDFLPQQRRLPQKSPFTPPKFLSIPARQIPLYCLYFLRGNRLFCRFIFPHETISVSAIFLWMKKAHRAKIVRIAKVFPCEVFFAKQNRLILKELRGRFSKRGFFGNEVQKPFVARRGARARHDGKLRLVADMGAHIEILAIYSGTKEIFATPPDRYTPF